MAGRANLNFDTCTKSLNEYVLSKLDIGSFRAYFANTLQKITRLVNLVIIAQFIDVNKKFKAIFIEFLNVVDISFNSTTSSKKF